MSSSHQYTRDGSAGIASIFRRIRDFLNWRLIRAIGQLQILTKASYVMLLVVPLLAGTWPAIRVYVNDHNKRAAELATRLEQAQTRLEAAHRILAPDLINFPTNGAPETPEKIAIKSRVDATTEKLADIEKMFKTTIDTFKNEHSERTLKDPKLPWSFAAAFFAALFCVLAHLMYQLSAPDVIKAKTLEEFVSDRKADYSKHPSDDAFRRAEVFSRTTLGERAQREEEIEAMRILSRLVEMKAEERAVELRSIQHQKLSSLANVLRNLRGNALDSFSREILTLTNEILATSGKSERQDMTIIERGAKAEYLYSAAKAPLAIVATAALYGVGIYVLLLIIKTQAVSVTKAAGWTSITNLFFR